MRSRLFPFCALTTALLAAAGLPPAALAQPTGDAGGSGAGGKDGAANADDTLASGKGEARSSGRRGPKGRPGVHLSPYIEAAQIVTAELSPGNEVLTYTRLAAGVDASMAGRNSAASVSLRYERYIGWGDRAGSGDVISGVARGYTTIAPGLQVEAGALAARSNVDANGASGFGGVGLGGDSGRVYSIYAGPALSTHAGDVKIDANYRFGYTRVEEPDRVVVTPGGGGSFDVFDDSTIHNANIHAGARPGDILPVGLGLGAGYYREDVSNLDQRVQDFHARADVTLPVALDVALVGGVGYEDVRISSRDVLRDTQGFPVVGGDGRFVTDRSSPRAIAYDTDGIIWDAGVLWRPSRRTALEAHVGRRYGSTTYYGSFAYAPNARSSINVAVYDNVSGFGGQVSRALADLPAEFEANRDPLTGELVGCVSSLEQGNCLVGVLGSIRSSIFRARGVMANYSVQLGRISAGIGAGYDRRKFIGARGTILEASNGVIDENIWLSGYLNARLDERSSLSTNVYANWFDSGSAFGGKSTGLGATVAYGRTIADNIRATAALGLDGVMREAPLVDVWEASALVGVKYSF